MAAIAKEKKILWFSEGQVFKIDHIFYTRFPTQMEHILLCKIKIIIQWNISTNKTVGSGNKI